MNARSAWLDAGTWTGHRRRVAALLQRHRWSRLAIEAARRDREVFGTLLAAALAFRIFLWLLPCTLLMVAVLGFSASDGQSLHHFAGQTGLSPLTASLLQGVGQQARSSRYLMAALGAGSLCVAGYGLGRALEGVESRIWQHPRPISLRARLPRAARYTGILLGMVLISMVGPILAHVADVPSGVVSAFTFPVFTVLGVELLRVDRFTRRRSLLPGALTFAAGLEGLRLIAVYYLPSKLSRASELYGTLGVAAALLVWLTLVARFLVLGHLLNAVLSEGTRPE